MIETFNLCKDYDGKKAVIDLNIRIEPGELFCLLGPNGAGKTTTFKILTGLLSASSGSASIGGFDIHKNPIEAKRRLGYIPDRPYLYEKLSGRDFITFVGDLFGIDRKVMNQRMDHYLDLFKLTEARDQYIENYSHGMRQKLVFASQLMHEPDAFIIDEPMVGLDPKSMHIVKKLMKDETRKGKAVLLSTHTLSDVEELADRIGVITRGKLVFVGTIDALRAEMKHAGRLEELFLQLTEEEVA